MLNSDTNYLVMDCATSVNDSKTLFRKDIENFYTQYKLISYSRPNYFLSLLGIAARSSVKDGKVFKKGQSCIKLGDRRRHSPKELNNKNISELMCTKTYIQALEMLDFMVQKDLLDYEVKKSNIYITLHNADLFFRNTKNTGKVSSEGYFFVPKIIRDKFAGYMSEIDGMIDLYCSTIVADPTCPMTMHFPVIQFEHKEKKNDEDPFFCFMSELADRWGLKSRSSAKKRIMKLVKLNYIAYYSPDTCWGGFILPTRYFELVTVKLKNPIKGKKYGIKLTDKLPPTANEISRIFYTPYRNSHKEITYFKSYVGTGFISHSNPDLKENTTIFNQEAFEVDILREAINNDAKTLFKNSSVVIEKKKDVRKNRFLIKTLSGFFDGIKQWYQCTFIRSDGTKIDIFSDRGLNFDTKGRLLTVA